MTGNERDDPECFTGNAKLNLPVAGNAPGFIGFAALVVL